MRSPKFSGRMSSELMRTSRKQKNRKKNNKGSNQATNKAHRTTYTQQGVLYCKMRAKCWCWAKTKNVGWLMWW